MAIGDSILAFAASSGHTCTAQYLDGGSSPVGSPVSLTETARGNGVSDYNATVAAADIPAGAAFVQYLYDAAPSTVVTLGSTIEGAGGSGGGGSNIRPGFG